VELRKELLDIFYIKDLHILLNNRKEAIIIKFILHINILVQFR